MKEGHLKNNTPMFIVRIEHFVKLNDFAIALTDYFYQEGEPFNEKLTKKEAEKILKRQLFFHGLRGEYPDGFFDSSYEEGCVRNKVFDDAIDWLCKKYEFLNSKKKKS